MGDHALEQPDQHVENDREENRHCQGNEQAAWGAPVHTNLTVPIAAHASAYPNGLGRNAAFSDAALRENERHGDGRRSCGSWEHTGWRVESEGRSRAPSTNPTQKEAKADRTRDCSPHRAGALDPRARWEDPRAQHVRPRSAIDEGLGERTGASGDTTSPGSSLWFVAICLAAAMAATWFVSSFDRRRRLPRGVAQGNTSANSPAAADAPVGCFPKSRLRERREGWQRLSVLAMTCSRRLVDLPGTTVQERT